jgi:hypothetical protein
MSEVLDRPRESQGLAEFLKTNNLAADWLSEDDHVIDRHDVGLPTRWVWTWRQ